MPPKESLRLEQRKIRQQKNCHVSSIWDTQCTYTHCVCECVCALSIYFAGFGLLFFFAYSQYLKLDRRYNDPSVTSYTEYLYLIRQTQVEINRQCFN